MCSSDLDLSGALTRIRTGVFRTDAAWRAVGRAHALAPARGPQTRIALLTSHLPRSGSEADVALRHLDGLVDAVVELGAPDAATRLADLALSAPVSGRGGRRKG